MRAPFTVSRALTSSGSAAQALDVGAGASVSSVAAAHEARFESMYRATFTRVYAFVRSQVATVDTAQELVSRIYLKAYQHRSKAPADEAMIQWIFRIARSTLIDYWRVERRRELASVPIEELTDLGASGSGDEDAEAAYARRQRGARLLELIAELTPEDQMLLALKFTAQRTNREIAEVLGISDAAVSMRLLRALRRLRQRLQDTGWQS